MHEQFQRAFLSPTTRHIDFYVEVLGMPLVHAMKVPPGLGAPLLNGGLLRQCGLQPVLGGRGLVQ